MTQQAGPTAKNMANGVLIVGANRVWAWFAKPYAADGCNVIATCRRPPRLAELRRVGVTIKRSIPAPRRREALAKKLADESIDVMIATGVWPRSDGLTDMPTEDFDLVMRTNVLGPLRLTHGVCAQHQGAPVPGLPVFAHGLDRHHEQFVGIAYCASKAALNAVVKSGRRAGQTRSREWRCILAGCAPTWSGPQASLTPTESVAHGMRMSSENASDKHGGFFDNTGATISPERINFWPRPSTWRLFHGNPCLMWARAAFGARLFLICRGPRHLITLLQKSHSLQGACGAEAVIGERIPRQGKPRATARVATPPQRPLARRRTVRRALARQFMSVEAVCAERTRPPVAACSGQLYFIQRGSGVDHRKRSSHSRSGMCSLLQLARITDLPISSHDFAAWVVFPRAAGRRTIMRRAAHAA